MTWIQNIPCRRKWQPTPVFLPGKSHGQRGLAGYSSSGCKRVRHDLAIKQHHQIFALGKSYLLGQSSWDAQEKEVLGDHKDYGEVVQMSGMAALGGSTIE